MIKIIEVSNAHFLDDITVSFEDFMSIQRTLVLSKFRHTIEAVNLTNNNHFYWHTQDTVGVSV